MDLGISIEEMRQSLLGIVAQCLIQVGSTEERKALYEILSEIYLVEAIASTMRGDEYKLPNFETLSYQLNRLEVNGKHATTTS